MRTVVGPDQTSSNPCIDICLSTTSLIRVNNARVIPRNARVATQHQHDPLWSRVIILTGAEIFENEFSLNWQRWPLFQPIYHPR